MNTVCFDGIQLYKEQFGASYTYDEDGNIVSVKDLQSQTTTYEYDETTNDLLKTILPTGAELTYDYDGYHNVTSATTETGVTYSFAYDAWGNNTAVSIVSGSVSISSSADYSDNGNYLESTTDAAGNTTRYGYNADTNVLEWVQYPEDTTATRTNYTYDNMYRVASSAATTDAGSALSVAYSYEDDLLKSITTPTTTYNFTYGNFALRSHITVGTRTLASYEYTSRTNYLSTLDYGNDGKVQYTYDKQGRVTQQTYEDGDTVTYKYDNSGALATVTDSATGRTTTYYYDFTDRLMKYVESGEGYSHSVGYEYDTINNLTALVEVINGVTHTTSYEYDLDNRVTSVTNGDTTKTYSYDGYSRVNEQVTKHNGTTVLTEGFTYRTPTATTTTGQVASYAIDAAGFDVTYSYTYDDNGNILSVSDGTNTTSYVYDTAGQLLRENNQAAGKTWVWTYDNAGNILTRSEYNYTVDSLDGITPVDTVSYTYGDTSWGDLLTSYDGQTITYDTIGNPLNDGTWTYTWEHGRQLASMTDGTTTWTYTYDANGLRTSRSNGTTTYNYIYNGTSLVQMTVGDDTLYFGTGTVTYNGVVYYYVTNLQGDVIAILDATGAAVVTYSYDAWGSILTTTGSMATTLGVANPLTYRGYVYDTETSLYYLQSRYYNSKIGRFINMDHVMPDAGKSILGNNLFAYCFNNPVNMHDSNGNWPEWVENAAKIVSAVVVVAAVVATVAAVSAFTAGTGTAAAVYASTVLLGASLSGINGAVANEAQGNSYLNGYIGGFAGGGTQAAASALPMGNVWGGGYGAARGTAITMVLNNIDPYSSDSTPSEIIDNSLSSGCKAAGTGLVTQFVSTSVDAGVANGCYGLMPQLTYGFGEAIKAFFGWMDDALVYII